MSATVTEFQQLLTCVFTMCAHIVLIDITTVTVVVTTYINITIYSNLLQYLNHVVACVIHCLQQVHM